MTYSNSDTVSQVHASNGKLLNTWTGATVAAGVLVAMGRVFVTGQTGPGNQYMINPAQAGGAVTVVSNGLGANSLGIAFDGSFIYTANTGGSVSIVTPGMTTPWSVANVTTGFSSPKGILFDGANIWVTDFSANSLLKLNQSGGIIQSFTVGSGPQFPAFDGTNIWAPNFGDNTVTVVRPATSAVVATLSGNGLNQPIQAAFDGQRILVTNFSGNSVSLWKAADLTPLSAFTTGNGSSPFGACSDGAYFWITLLGTN